MRSICFIVCFTLWTGVADAQPSQECLSQYTRYDVCEAASKIQRELANTLPMKLNQNITLATASAIGSMVIVTALWDMSKHEMDGRLESGGMPFSDFSGKISLMTQNTVCGMAAAAAFVRLGGKIQYIYKTVDGYPVLKPIVDRCPL